MQIPTRKACYQMMVTMEMLPNIAVHSIVVCGVALSLAERFISLGVVLSKELVQAAGLLHDITKTRSFSTGENHAQSGGVFLDESGFPLVGDIVRQHVQLDTPFDQLPPTEAVLVNYADKRVLHDQIVPLRQRMAYIRERYGRNADLKEKIDALTKEITRQEIILFEPLKISPDQLDTIVGQDQLGLEVQAFRRLLSAGS